VTKRSDRYSRPNASGRRVLPSGTVVRVPRLPRPRWLTKEEWEVLTPEQQRDVRLTRKRHAGLSRGPRPIDVRRGQSYTVGFCAACAKVGRETKVSARRLLAHYANVRGNPRNSDAVRAAHSAGPALIDAVTIAANRGNFSRGVSRSTVPPDAD
jgi:hypothetical protein